MTKKLRKMERENDTLKGKCESMGKDIDDLREEVRTGAAPGHPSPWRRSVV